MKITKEVYFSQEVEVDINTDDIHLIFAEAEAGGFKRPIQYLREINNIAQFLEALPDTVIAGFNDSQRKCIREFLSEQSKRFNP